MEWVSLNDLREKYLTFFESKGHLRHKSYPLVPIGDKSVLLINAGMTPLKKYFTGEVEPPRHRMTTCQKCIRTPDIDRVGITARHGTYFEMLGNFSFGDYFKEEAISWAWEFITEILKMPIEKLWVTVFENDDEAFSIWNQKIGVDASHIVRLGKEDNFWEHGSGPCGPCSEIYYDRGPEFGCGKPDCKPGCDCDRYMEFWNLVFTQFDNDGNGNYSRLAKPNIDTGMGLERLACIMQGVNNLFEVDTVRNIMKAVSDKTTVHYGQDAKSDISLRVITDHIRSSTFMICDGIIPSNEGRGYVLRRLLRRAARHGKLLGISGLFLGDICEVVARENYSEYPELTEKLDYIKKVITMEEKRFASTIDAGQVILTNIAKKAIQNGLHTISGEDAFKLYDTYGFPFDLTNEIASEMSLDLDKEGFERLMKAQKESARAARASISGWSDASKSLLSQFPKTEFVGYTQTSCQATVIGILVDDMSVPEVTEGDFSLITNKTVFYGEGGGQVGDSGIIRYQDTLISVTDTQKSDGVYIHLCTMVSGNLKVGTQITAEVDEARRTAIRRNHSTCHLLQAALRTVLGNHVEQAGSHVDENHVRFDFTHFSPLTEQELYAVESLVNAHIFLGEPITTIETDVETAKKSGAMALFGEKYGSVVRMVTMGSFSTELCGGTHMDNTGKIGLFKITSESSVAAGVRRIEGVTGTGVLSLIKEKEELINATASQLKLNNVSELATRAAQLQSELKSAKSEIEALQAKMARLKKDEILKSAQDVHGVSVLSAKTEGLTLDAVRGLCDDIRQENQNSVIIVAAVLDGKLNFVCSCGKEALKKGANAGKIIREVAAICNGGGGGRPDNATAGGKDLSKIDAALKSTPEICSHFIDG
jgi:alanyl-tRNA synthetase